MGRDRLQHHPLDPDAPRRALPGRLISGRGIRITIYRCSRAGPFNNHRARMNAARPRTRLRNANPRTGCASDGKLRTVTSCGIYVTATEPDGGPARVTWP